MWRGGGVAMSNINQTNFAKFKNGKELFRTES